MSNEAEILKQTAARLGVTATELKALQSICKRRGFKLSNFEKAFCKWEMGAVKRKAKQSYNENAWKVLDTAEKI